MRASALDLTALYRGSLAAPDKNARSKATRPRSVSLLASLTIVCQRKCLAVKRIACFTAHGDGDIVPSLPPSPSSLKGERRKKDAARTAATPGISRA